MVRTYSELILLPSFEERFEYLKDSGVICEIKFGHRRCLNQDFYNSTEWKIARRKVILRDNGCDLGLPDYPINGTIYVHHMNPITEEDLLYHSKFILDPEYLICVSYSTHYAITYGDPSFLPKPLVSRKKFDTCPWRNNNG